MQSPPPPPDNGPSPDGALVPYGLPPSDLRPLTSGSPPSGSPPSGSPPSGYPPSGYPPSAVRPPTSGLARYLTFLGRKWWIVLLSVLLFGGLAAAYIAWWPASYASTARLWAAGRMGLQLREGMTYAENSLNFAGTQIELLQSDLILGRAFNRLQQTLHISFPTNSEGKPILPTIKVSQLPKSAMLELKAKGPTENSVVAFLNAVMDEFLAYKKEVRSASSGDTYTSVSEQTVKQEAELKAEQDKLNAYMRDNNVAVLEEQAKAASTYLTQLLAEFSELKLQYQILEATSGEGPFALAAMTNVLAGAPDPRQLASSSLPSASPPPEFLGAQQKLEEVRIMRTRLSKFLRPEHPKIVKLDEQIAQGEKLVEFLSRQSRDQLANAKQTTKMRIDRIQETIKEWETKVNNASERIAEYERMKLSVGRLQGLHDSLLALLQTVDVSKNLDQENITILDRPSEAKDAKKPILVTAFLLFVGLGAGLGLVFLVEQKDDRVMSLEELTGRFDEWIVGQVPEVPRLKKKKKPALVTMDDDRHIFAESHRAIRSALWFATNPEDKPKALLVTSAIPNEGKSTVAANLARTMAFAGARVLLIDADLRRGLLHELFEVPAEPGLSDLLAQGGDYTQYLHQIPLSPPDDGPPTTDHGPQTKDQGPQPAANPPSSDRCPPSSGFRPPSSDLRPPSSGGCPPSSDGRPPSSDLRPPSSGQLHFLPRGKRPDNSGELFLSANCDRLLARAREEFDCVILDSIPVFAADDTTSLAPKVDGVLFVVRNSFTSADTARHALELLYERQAKILGLVFNRADSASRSYKHYKYAKYYHSEKA